MNTEKTDSVSGTEINDSINGVAPKSKAKKTVKATAPAVGSVYTSYEVKSKGYQETFSNLDEANRQADILKKRAIKNGDSVNIKVCANKQDDEKQHIIRGIKIDEGFYNN